MRDRTTLRGGSANPIKTANYKNINILGNRLKATGDDILRHEVPFKM